MQITSGKIPGAQKVVLYGPEGIGKSTFAAQFPNPVFCDTEGSTKHLDVRRSPRPQSWAELLEQVKYFTAHPGECTTFVLDTADWAERLRIDHLCAKAQKAGIEDFGYGKGFTYLAEEFGRLLDLLTELIEKGVNVVITAHAQMRKFEQPDEMGAYDRWELKLQKKTAPLVKEWADMVLFMTYKTHVINVDGQGAEKGKNKAQGGSRVMRTAHHPCWDAKNRHGLPSEMPMDYAKIAHLFTAALRPESAATSSERSEARRSAESPEAGSGRAPSGSSQEVSRTSSALIPETSAPDAQVAGHDVSGSPGESDDWPLDEEVPPALAALMKEHKVNVSELRGVVFERGYYPAATKIMDYDPDFVKGVLVGAWPQVLSMILKNREDTPF